MTGEKETAQFCEGVPVQGSRGATETLEAGDVRLPRGDQRADVGSLRMTGQASSELSRGFRALLGSGVMEPGG